MFCKTRGTCPAFDINMATHVLPIQYQSQPNGDRSSLGNIEDTIVMLLSQIDISTYIQSQTNGDRSSLGNIEDAIVMLLSQIDISTYISEPVFNSLYVLTHPNLRKQAKALRLKCMT